MIENIITSNDLFLIFRVEPQFKTDGQLAAIKHQLNTSIELRSSGPKDCRPHRRTQLSIKPGKTRAAHFAM